MGSHEHKRAAPAHVVCAVLTVSDSRVPDDDRSGARIRERLEQAGHTVAAYRIVPDERAHIVAAVESFATEVAVDAVLVTGGTGLAPRDVTYESIRGLLNKTIDGFGELFRMLSYEEIGAAAMLSRATAGVMGRTVVFVLPGSPAACELAIDKLILPELAHAVSIANPRATRDL